MLTGVDFSEFGGPINQAQVARWKARGIDFAIPQYSQWLPLHLQTLEAAGGLEIETYVYLFWGLSPWNQTPLDRVKAALQMCWDPAGRYRVRRLWLDAEDSSSPYREDQLLECVDYLDQVGMPTGIYTGRWWWIPKTGNSTRFAHLPLWHAEYIGQGSEPDLGAPAPGFFDNFDAYGGWVRPHTWQFWGTANLEGHSVDVNARLEAAPAPPPILIPSDQDIRLALGSSLEYLRRGWNPADGMIPMDKAAIAEWNRRVNG